MKIYGDSISGNCLKVKWVADLLGLSYDWIETDILVGKREDVLRRPNDSEGGDGWQIARRTILLDQNVLLSKNLTFFF